MASYTMTLGEVIEMLTPDGATSLSDRIEKGRTKLFDFDYEIFDSNYKQTLETHFIRKFYMREIGTETEGLFKFNLETWMLINMPYFNKLFEAELIDYDPLSNSHRTSTKTVSNDKKMNGTSTNDGSNTANSNQSSNNSSNSSSFDRHLGSDNPDSRLSITPNSDGSGTIEYAKEITEDTNTVKDSTNSTSQATNTNKSSSTNTSNGEVTETETDTQSSTGKIGVQTYSAMLNEYRASIQRIENMMFKEMEQLFMLVY